MLDENPQRTFDLQPATSLHLFWVSPFSWLDSRHICKAQSQPNGFFISILTAKRGFHRQPVSELGPKLGVDESLLSPLLSDVRATISRIPNSVFSRLSHLQVRYRIRGDIQMFALEPALSNHYKTLLTIRQS